jgi:hypothetical protein
MSLFKNIQEFDSYLSSIRVADKFIFIDLIFPKTWLIPQAYMTDKFVVTFPIKNDSDSTGITFVIEANEDKFNTGVEKIFKIIRDNKEIEQKSILLNKNIDILKVLFNQNKLDDLSKLEFLLPKNELKNGKGENVENPRSRKKQGLPGVGTPEDEVHQ